MTKRFFSTKGYRFKSLLELIHTDVCRLLNVRVRGIFEYFITFIDDYSRYDYIYLFQCKFEAFEKFKEFRTETEKWLDNNIESLQSNRGGEYLSSDFDKYLLDNGILSQLSAPGMPQQNSMAERKNRIVLDIVRSMMSYSDLPNFLWGYALEMKAYDLNSVQIKSIPNTHVQLWIDREGSI